jgi:hypothetical protein
MLLGWAGDDLATMSMSIRSCLDRWTTRDGTYAQGGLGEEIVIVNLAGDMRWIMVLAEVGIEGFKGNMWVHRWWLGQQGRTAKVEVVAQGGCPLPSKVDGYQRLLMAAAEDKVWYWQGGQ